MAKKLINAHIFSVGTWNRTTVTSKTLEGIVAAFNELAQAGRVPLKFGHNDEQPLTDGQPALGWVSKLWHDGQRLFADFADMPNAVYEAVKSKLYKFVSVELLTNAEREGKKYPFVLDAVALLGADPPAVTNLQELEALATMSRIAYTVQGERLGFKQGLQTTGGDDDMDEEMKKMLLALQQGQAAQQVRLDTLTTENVELKTKFTASEAAKAALQAQLDATVKTEKAEKVKMARENAMAVLEVAVREKRILPAQRESYTKLFKLNDDEAILVLDIKDLESLVSTKLDDAKKVLMSKSAITKGPGDTADDTDDAGENDPNEEISTAALKYANENKVSVFTALPEVLKLNPKLARQFCSINFEKSEARA